MLLMCTPLLQVGAPPHRKRRHCQKAEPDGFEGLEEPLSVSAACWPPQGGLLPPPLDWAFSPASDCFDYMLRTIHFNRIIFSVAWLCNLICSQLTTNPPFGPQSAHIVFSKMAAARDMSKLTVRDAEDMLAKVRALTAVFIRCCLVERHPTNAHVIM